MKLPHIILLLLVLSLCACSKYAQIIHAAPHPSSPNLVDDGEKLVFENDTLRIVYSFWQNRGVMSFGVFNKLNVPLYLDWKKSSYVESSMKLDYYREREVRVSVSESQYFVNSTNLNLATVPFFSSNTTGVQTVSKEERVTFIPPKSGIVRKYFKLFPKLTHFSIAGSIEEVIPAPTSNVQIKVKSLLATPDKSKFRFRNFLTFSTKETFENEFFVNNEFYINKVVTMKSSEFKGTYDAESDTYDYTFKDNRNFYIPNINKSSLFEK
jgi:hypothetical protein